MILMALKLAAMSVAVYVTAAIVPGIRVRSPGTAVVVAGVYGLLNVALGWLVHLIILPLAWLTLGIAVNAILLWVTDKLMDDFEIEGPVPLVIGAVLITAMSWALRTLIGI